MGSMMTEPKIIGVDIKRTPDAEAALVAVYQMLTRAGVVAEIKRTPDAISLEMRKHG
jgi:hypothetical protein